MTQLFRPLSALFLALLIAGPASAQVTVVIVGGDKADITIDIPIDDDESISADMEVEFENPVNLTAECLNVSAVVLDAAAINAINARLPTPLGRFDIDPLFPLLITIEPLPACNLQFDNQIEFEIHTEELSYNFPSPYRLMKAPVTGTFRDVTANVLSGSIRANGSGGTFSEFVIARNVVVDLNGDALAGFADLESRINGADLSLLARNVLTEDLASARAAYERGFFTDSISRLQAMVLTTRSLGGGAIPNRWRSERDLVNAVGEIKGLTDALAYRIARVANLP
ncbi:MAG: hypothetical protein IPK97_18565 [Ahniella sp.]|nr:hypothetical protein [Ahniella sp.]